MSGAFAWGLIASSSLLVGALLVMWKPIRQQTLGLVMAFGAGVLISAVAYELVAEAIETAGDAEGRLWAVGAGLAAGALTFFLGDWYIDRMGGEKRKRSQQEAGDSALPLTLGIVLDGIPESIVLGSSGSPSSPSAASRPRPATGSSRTRLEAPWRSCSRSRPARS